MAFQTHISLASVDEMIDYYIAQHDTYEDGPAALYALYEFVISGISEGKFDDPAAICKHTWRRLQECQR